MMDSHTRLHQAIDYLKDKGRIHKQQDIADILHMGRSRVSEALKGKEGKLTKFFLTQFASAYSGYINESWLVEGIGEMMKPGNEMKPHIQAKVSARHISGVSEGDYGNNLKPLIPFLPDYDFTIEVYGSSMVPEYREGDILACRVLQDRWEIEIGNIYVIDTKEEAVIKQLKQKKENTVILHSLNPEYLDLEVESDNIIQVAEVVGLVRVE